MRFFLDTANVEEIKKANDMVVICGVTTNPSIIAKEGRDFNEVIKEIAAIVDGPISGEVKATTVDAEGMIKEGREIAKIHKNMVVKLPTTAEGLKACRVLSGEGIKTNLTLIFNVPQAIPVSYTHLDVYKRQVICWLLQVININNIILKTAGSNMMEKKFILIYLRLSVR